MDERKRGVEGRLLHLGREKDNTKGRVHKISYKKKKKKKKKQKAGICISKVTTCTWDLAT